MKTQNLFDEISKNVKNNKILTDKEKLDEGQTMWLRGIPVEYEKETIGLNVGLNEVIVVKADDVLDIMKDDGMYYFKVKKGTKVIFKIQVLNEVTDHNTCCSNDNKVEIKLNNQKDEGNWGGTRTMKTCDHILVIRWIRKMLKDSHGLYFEIRIPEYTIEKVCY